MHKDQIEKVLIKIIQQRTPIRISKKKINDDLYKKALIDSFDILNIINDIENYFKIDLKIEKIKKFTFSIKFLIDLVKKKIKK